MICHGANTEQVSTQNVSSYGLRGRRICEFLFGVFSKALTLSTRRVCYFYNEENRKCFKKTLYTLCSI